MRSAAVIALGAVALLVTAVGTAPAGNRDPEPTLDGFPGPGEINYGENVGYTAKLPNSQSSTFTHLVYHHLVPTTLIGGVSTPAKLIYASCEPGRTSWPAFAAGATYACPERTLAAGATASVLLVWQAPGKPTEGDNVSCGAATNCVLESSGFWTIKEGTGNDGSGGPDTFPGDKSMLTTLLGAAPDLTKARGYVLNACNTGSSLETSVVTPVSSSNRLFTRICATSTPSAAAFPLAPGLIVQIDETNPSGKGFPKAFVCIPAPPSSTYPTSVTNPNNTCPATPGGSGYQPWEFLDLPNTTADERGRFDFTIDNTQLPNGEKVDKVLHDVNTGDAIPPVDITGDCTISPVNSLKITNVSCNATFNGSWDFG